jgi:hypothetical protein
LIRFVHAHDGETEPAAPAASSSPTNEMHRPPDAPAESPDSWLTRLAVQLAPVGTLPVGRLCSSANARTKSSVAVVVTAAAVVVVPADPAIVLELEASNAATPEYSQADRTMSAELDGLAEIVDSFPADVLYQL